MKNHIKQHFSVLKDTFDGIVATDKKGSVRDVSEAIDTALGMIRKTALSGGKLLFIGNGGSAAISSHIATDFWKNGGVKAVAFNDISLLTCVSNDYGYESVFEKPIDMFADKNDTVFAISSSGASKNILKGARASEKKGAGIITLSGFGEDNPLRAIGDINFYVPSDKYGHVETAHMVICHFMADTFSSGRNG